MRGNAAGNRLLRKASRWSHILLPEVLTDFRKLRRTKVTEEAEAWCCFMSGTPKGDLFAGGARRDIVGDCAV